MLPTEKSRVARPLFPFCVGSGLAWPDCFFPFVLGPDPTQKGKSGLATRDYPQSCGLLLEITVHSFSPNVLLNNNNSNSTEHSSAVAFRHGIIYLTSQILIVLPLLVAQFHSDHYTKAQNKP